MSRRDFDVAGVIDSYKEKKTEADAVKKEADKLNKEIKTYLIGHDLDTACSEKWVAKISKSSRDTMDEEKAIQLLEKELTEEQLNSVIEIKKSINEEALNNLAYNGQFDLSKLEDCMIKGKEVITLRISAKK